MYSKTASLNVIILLVKILIYVGSICIYNNISNAHYHLTLFSVQLLVVFIMGDNSVDEVLEISRDQFVQKVDEALRQDYGFFFSHEEPIDHQVILYFFKCIFIQKNHVIFSITVNHVHYLS
ncbi:hypothetical protein Hdeb2414_s0011g00367541 [Helianthus debilis subsp. tardiflorus]